MFTYHLDFGLQALSVALRASSSGLRCTTVLRVPFSLLCCVGVLTTPATTLAADAAPNLGLTVRDDGALLRDGRPYRAVGVNYFDALGRQLRDPKDETFDAGFTTLAERGIPFARIRGCGFWPSEQKLYQDNPKEFFERFDRVVRAAERHGIGLIPSLFWHTATVPDLVGEPVAEWGNPQSKTHAYLRGYVRDVVTRYGNSPAIWAWEFGNEYNLPADLPNAAQHRPPIVPKLGTPAARGHRDELSYENVRTALAAFAAEVRKYDPHRPIFTGNSVPRPSAWHNWKEKRWTTDTPEQFALMLREDNPDPTGTICVHLYGDALARLSTITELSRRWRRPLFVGEFGASGPREKCEPEFRALLAAIEKADVPLAALWVYDFKGQDSTWNVTATNPRAYQLEAIAEVNARLRRASQIPDKAPSPDRR
jgi:hypothetical protein